MAYVFGTNGDGLNRTANLLDYNAAYTWMLNIFLTGNIGGNTTITAVNDGSLSNYDHMGMDSNGSTFRVSSQSNFANGSGLSTGQWYNMCLVRESASSLKGYIDGVVDATVTIPESARPAVGFNEISSFQGLGRYLPGRVDGIKMWTTALTQAEIQQEMKVKRPVRFANLSAWYPTFSNSDRNKDLSGNGYNWAESGTLANGDPAPISWGGRVLVRRTTIIPPVVQEQEGYRFRNDDGSETTATWAASQDTSYTMPVSTVKRLRTLINATSDPAASEYKLQYRKVGDDTWMDVQ